VTKTFDHINDREELYTRTHWDRILSGGGA